jgi:glycosyltransferase involved in cell wall biosynthesis
MRVLTANHHSAYLYLLAHTGHAFDVVGKWDFDNRPLPANFEMLSSIGDARDLREYRVIIGHRPTDFASLLPRAFAFRIPYVQVIHGNVRRVGEGRGSLRAWLRRASKRIGLRALFQVFALSGAVRFVFISQYDKQGWGVEGAVIDHGIPISEMYPYTGEKSELLTVGNALHREHFDRAMMASVREKLPVQIIGVNSKIEGSRPSRDWDDLRAMYQTYRSYLNFTREPERGYTLSTLEAMAVGMPVVAIRHRVTPIVDGENGFLVDTAEEMIARARLLLADVKLARRLGQSARQTVKTRYGIDRFVGQWNEVLYAAAGQRIKRL